MENIELLIIRYGAIWNWCYSMPERCYIVRAKLDVSKRHKKTTMAQQRI